MWRRVAGIAGTLGMVYGWQASQRHWGGGGRDCVPALCRDCEGTGGMQPKELIADIQARGVITFSTQKMAYLLGFLLHE